MDSLLSIKYWYILPIAYVGIFFNQYFGSEYVVYGILLFGIGLSVRSLHQGALFFITILLLFDDFPFKPQENLQFYSIYTVTFFGQTLTKILSIWLFGMVIYQAIKDRKVIVGNLFSKVFIGLMILSIIVGVASLNYQYKLSFINDFRFFFNYIVGFGLAAYLLSRKSYFKIVFPLMTIIFLSKIIVLIGTSIVLLNGEALYTLKTGTGSYLIIFIVCYLIHLFTEKKYFFYSSAGLVLALSLLVLSASRGRMVITALAIVLYLIAIRKAKYLPLIAVFAGVAILGIAYLNPTFIDYTIWKLSSFIPQKGSAQSAYVRFVEMSNILHKNFTELKSFLVGDGLGSYWNSKYEEYPFELMNTSSYPDDWILRDRFFKPHGIVQFLLLKSGFIGTLMFYGSLIFLMIKNFMQYGKNQILNKESSSFVTIIGIGLIPFYLIAFSAKLQLFGGIMVGISFCYNKIRNVE